MHGSLTRPPWMRFDQHARPFSSIAATMRLRKTWKRGANATSAACTAARTVPQSSSTAANARGRATTRLRWVSTGTRAQRAFQAGLQNTCAKNASTRTPAATQASIPAALVLGSKQRRQSTPSTERTLLQTVPLQTPATSGVPAPPDRPPPCTQSCTPDTVSESAPLGAGSTYNVAETTKAVRYRGGEETCMAPKTPPDFV